MTIVCNGVNARPQDDSETSPTFARPQEELKFSGHGVTAVPEHIKKNAQLRILDLSHNRLGHGGHEALKGLVAIRHLARLNLSGNELKELPWNPSASLFLEVLCLSGNELEVLPEAISDLYRLKRLHCDYNRLRSAPADWSPLASLSSLTLSNNRLEEIPATLWTLQSLRGLNLHRNRISNVGPLPSGAAGQLRELRLGRNRLTGSVDLSPLGSLSYLDVSYNELEDLEVCKLLQLDTLIASHNRLKQLTLDGAKLRVLKVDGNELEAIHRKQPVVYLENFDVSHNHLASLPLWLSDAKILTSICADHNQIASLPKEILNCSGLRSLKLNHNRLDKFPEMSSPCLINCLLLQYNKIEKLPENFFTVFPCLETLNLAYNCLQTLPPSTCTTNLKMLILSGNYLKGMNGILNLLKNSRLECLHLAYNGIKDIPTEFFTSLPLLVTLSLSGNEVLDVSSHLTRANRLKKLYLHSNKLNTLPALGEFSNLQVLDVACNEFHKLELAAVVPAHLSYLDLSANCDLLIDPKDFQHLCCQRSVAVVDVNCAGRQAPLSESSPVKQSDGVSPWLLGFTESHDGNTRLYIEMQKDSGTGREEALIALMEVDDLEQIRELRHALPGLLKIERDCKETYPHYLRNSLISSIRFLRSRGYTKELGITMCHLSSFVGSPVTLRLGTVGRPSSCVLGRAGNVIVLAQRFENVSVGIEDWKDALEEAEICCTNHLNTATGDPLPKGSWASIPDPEVRELVLSPQDKFLVFGDSAFSRTVPADEVCRQVQTTPSPVSAAKSLAEMYSALSNGRRECVAVIMLRSSNTPHEEEVEKYRCWEFMLEQNHKLLFTKELETIHKSILRNGGQRESAGNGDPSSWYTAALSKYKCPLPSHRGRYYCYGNSKSE